VYRWLLAGCGLALLLVVLILLRYPGNAATTSTYWLYGAGAVGVLALVAGGIVFWRGQTLANAGPIYTLGVRGGLVLGLLWVVEISFNNVVPPEISTGAARFIVDNAAWLGIWLGTVALGFVGSLRTGRVATGLLIGLWSGLISGGLACLTALLLIVFGMPLLLRDPLNQAEWIKYGAEDGAPDMATYFAYETLAGAFWHLVFLGVLAGGALGGFGGLLAVSGRRHVKRETYSNSGF
jgi:hypothetical protein